MTKLTNAEKDKLDNTCGNLRVTKLGTHVKSLEDFVNQGALATRANDVTAAINELYGMIRNNECADIQIPPPGFFTLFGNDEDGKLYVYYNDEDHPPVFRHVEEPGELEGTLYLYIADPEGETHFEMEIGHYIAVRHLDNYYTKAEIDAGYAIKDHAVNANTYGLGSTSKYGHVKTINGLTQASHADGLALSAYQGKVLKTEIDKKVVTVQQLATATQGFTASYVIKQNGVQVGDTINIPKDFLVKSAELKTVTTVNQPVQGFKVGDKYIDWVINTIDSSENPQHLYLNVTDLIDVYTADEVTITLENNQFKIKNGGVGSTQLAKDSVITDKIKDSNVTTAKIKDGNVTTVKIKDANVTTDKIADSNVTTDKIANGAVTNDKVASITKNKISDFSHAHGNLQNDGKVGTTNNANKNVVTDGDGKITTEAKPVVVDAVEEGNINAVSSNAVYDYVGDVSKEIPVKNYQQFISLIARAEDGDVIVLDADYNFSKTPLTYYPVGISKSLTIFGNGHRIYTENDEKNTYFTVRSGVNHKTTLAFYDTVFTNLKCDESLFATDNQYYPYSELIFDNCMFINNSAKVICDGSLGDYSTDPGDEDKEAKITIRKCTFKNNKTTYGTLFFKYYSSVTDSVFTANTASTTGYGGAIHRVSGNVSVVDCEFNTTTDTVVGVTPIDSIQQKINTSIAGKIDTAGAGLTKEGTTLKHSNNVTAQTSSALKKIKYDAQGHITGTDAVAKSDITGLGIPAQDTVYTHPNSGANADTTGKFNKLKYNAQGHVTGAVAVAKSDITALGIPGQDTTYTPASENPLMDGSVDKGSSEKYAREDHRHPTDTSRAAASHSHRTSDISDFPTSMTPSSHSHGSLANGGTLNSDISSVNKIAVTDSSNNLKTISKLPADKVTHQDISGKVDKVTGKGLSTEDFTTAEKTKLAGIETGANKTVVDSALSTTSTNPVQNKKIKEVIDTLATKEEVDDIIAGDIDLTGYVKDTDSRLSDSRTPKSHTHGNLQNDGSVGTSNNASKNVVTDANGKITTEAKPTVPTANSTASNIKMDGTQSAGSLSTFAKADHVHPTDTSRASTAVATQSANGLMSSTDKTKLDGIATGANKITVDSALSTTSTNPVQNKVINTSLGNKVDKVSGKGLSTNDFTDDLKTKLDGIATGATKVTVDSALSTTSTNPVQNKVVNSALAGKAPTTHTHHDTDLDWNGVALANKVSPVDMAMYEEFSANRLAYLSGDNITVEYSTDNGSTWTETATDTTGKANKVKLVTTQAGFTGGNGATKSANNQVRITLKAGNANQNSAIYLATRKFMIYFSTGGSSGCKCKVDYSTYGAPTTWTTLDTYTINGYDGWNSIPVSLTWGGFATQCTGTRVQNIRFTFSCTTIGSANINVQKIRAFGESCWIFPSTLAATGHIYTFDENQNATFPGKIIKSGGTSAQFLKADGSVDGTTYVSGAGTGLTKDGANLKHSNSVTADTTGNFKKLKYDAQGHVTGAVDVAKADITGLGIPAQDTTYSAEKGITLSSGKFGHSNSVTADTTGNFKKLKYDAQGHITGTADVAKSDITALGIPAQDTVYSHPNSGVAADTTGNFKKLKYNAQGHITGAVDVAGTDLPAHTNSDASKVGKADASNFGHTKLSDNYTSSAGAASAGIGASSKAVYDAYNTLNTNKISKTSGSTNLLLASGSTTPQSTFAVSGHHHTTEEIVAHDDQNASLTTLLASKAPIDHAVNNDNYGLATTGVYGHTKIVQNLTTADGNGLALGAGQGKALKAEVDKKWNKATTSMWQGDGVRNIDFNNFTTPGAYKIWGANIISDWQEAHSPNSRNQGGLLLVYETVSGVTQILINYYDHVPGFHYRINYGDSWRAWQTVYTQSNIPSASTSQKGIVQLVNDVTTGGEDKALTAEQGKTLKNTISNIKAYKVYINTSADTGSAPDDLSNIGITHGNSIYFGCRDQNNNPLIGYVYIDFNNGASFTRYTLASTGWYAFKINNAGVYHIRAYFTDSSNHTVASGMCHVNVS